MNATSRAILQTVLSSDSALTEPEQVALREVLDGRAAAPASSTDCLSLTQKAAAKMLSVSRVTIWRMTRDKLLHPVEILPGIWRYPFDELASLAKRGWQPAVEMPSGMRARTA